MTRARLFASWTDAQGNTYNLEGASVEALAAQLPADYDGPRLTVRDEQGSVCGRIDGREDWRGAVTLR